MIVNVITAISVAVLLALIAYMVIGYLVRNREERIAFIRSFKNGKCLVIYLLAIPLYTLGRSYQGAGVAVSFFDVLEAFFYSLKNAVSLIVMDFGLDSVAKLISDSMFYRLTMYFIFILVIMNTVLFWLSLAGQYFWLFRRDLEGKLTKKDLLYILGYNEQNVNIYNSDDKNYKFIVGDIDEKSGVELYGKKIAHYASTNYARFIDVAFNKAEKCKQKVTVIINTGIK